MFHNTLSCLRIKLDRVLFFYLFRAGLKPTPSSTLSLEMLNQEEESVLEKRTSLFSYCIKILLKEQHVLKLLLITTTLCKGTAVYNVSGVHFKQIFAIMSKKNTTDR